MLYGRQRLYLRLVLVPKNGRLPIGVMGGLPSLVRANYSFTVPFTHAFGVHRNQPVRRCFRAVSEGTDGDLCKGARGELIGPPVIDVVKLREWWEPRSRDGEVT